MDFSIKSTLELYKKTLLVFRFKSTAFGLAAFARLFFALACDLNFFRRAVCGAAVVHTVGYIAFDFVHFEFLLSLLFFVLFRVLYMNGVYKNVNFCYR